MFPDVSASIIYHDPYMVLADFADYRLAQQKIEELWKDREAWNRMSLMNISGAGRFAADRAINEYAANIWNTQPAVKPAAKPEKKPTKKAATKAAAKTAEKKTTKKAPAKKSK